MCRQGTLQLNGWGVLWCLGEGLTNMGKLAKAGPLWGRMMVSASQQGFVSPESLIYALDPGETTGRCIYHQEDSWGDIVELEQLDTQNVVKGYDAIRAELLSLPKLPQIVVCEGYVVYSYKSDDHKWNTLHTPQLIGAIKVLCHQLNIPIKFQLAVQAKGFVTDEMLENWGVYIPGMKHARDAQRHALYYKMLAQKPYKGKGSEHVEAVNS